MSVDLTPIKQLFSVLTLEKLPTGIITFVLAYFVSRLMLKLVDQLLARSPLEKTIAKFLRSAARILMWALNVLVVASTLGIDVSSMVALLSVASLAISLAVQGALSNLAGGIMLLSTHPFHVGDYVEVGQVAGTVLEIGMTYTTLTTPDMKQIFVPNSEISAAKIINYTAVANRRVDLTFSASYQDDTEQVKAALRKAAALPQVLNDPPPFIAVSKYGDSAIEYVVRVWTPSANYWDVYFTLTERVKRCFDEAGVTMTYPHLNVHVEKGYPENS